MKMVYISCNISSLDSVLEMIKKEKISSYQIIEEASGVFPKGEPRLNTAVWPGLNSIVFATCSETQCKNLKQEISIFNQKVFNDNELVYINSWSIDDE